ncbi:MAG: ATP-dependent Clp protease adaptor ClpS [Phycisphaerae bacterium]|nr:ATP-dependent Clp protease adaptor ClpS [Phycisphaerae bacterium]
MANDERENNPTQADVPAAATKAPPKKAPARPRPKQPPNYKVLLHNDDHNDMEYVARTVRKLTPLNTEEAVRRMWEAHTSGVALLLVTHQERAELYVEQFASCGLIVTIEPES